MKRSSKSAQQLPLTLFDSVDRQQALTQCEAHARAMADENALLTAENQALCEALATEKARALDLQRELIFAQTLARTWEVQVKLGRGEAKGWTPPKGMSRRELTVLLSLVHPDRWSQGQLATELAHEAMVLVNRLREGVA